MGKICLLLFTLSAQSETLPDEQIRAAAAKSVALLQRSSKSFYNTQTCFSCHHQALPIMALRLARERGIPVDEIAAREVALKAFPQSLASIDRAVQGPFLIDPALDDGFRLVSAHDAGIRPSLTTAALARRIAGWQRPAGDWQTPDVRPPQAHSPFTATAVAVRALRLYMPQALREETERQTARAREWLAATEPRTSEDHAFRLFGLAWAGADPHRLKSACEPLLALQQPDGGWAQIPSRGGDAYATGQVLAALHQAGGIPVSHAAWRRGLRYLLDSQKEDGSWLVSTRMVSPAQVSPPYFESGFPHGKNQFISAAATSWAVMALALALPRADRPSTPLPVPEAEPPGVAPWMETALGGGAEELRALLDDGLDPNSSTAGGTTALMMAAPDAAKVKLLIERGAQAGAKAKSGYTALMIASMHLGTSAAVRLLLSHGADAAPGKGVIFNASPLFLASYAGDRENVAILIGKGADVRRKMLLLGQFPQSPLLAAVFQQNTDVIGELARAGADVQENDADHMTPLHWAAVGNRVEVARLLIQSGARVNASDRYGYTPLHYAANIDFGDTEMVELLLRAGANPHVRAKNGKTALSLARELRYPDLARALEGPLARRGAE